MSQDELMVLFASAGLAIWLGLAWYTRVATTNLVAPPPPWFKWLTAAPPLAVAGIFAVLKFAASYDVRDAPQYLLFYAVLGAAWLFLSVRVLTAWGVSFRDDAVERRNPAAAIVIGSTLAAHAAIYSGANIGDGPGWWIVVFAGGLGVCGWLVLWWMVESACGASEQITVERDVSAAIRFGGYMIASGLIWGRAVAGDWISLEYTLADMWVAWPAVALTAAAIGVERWRRGQVTSVSTSLALAAFYVAAAIAALATAPALSHNPAYDVAP